MASAEPPIEARINAKSPRRVNTEFGCAAVFYGSVLAHMIMSFIIFSSKNTDTFVYDAENYDFVCPSGMKMCVDKQGAYFFHSHLCMTDALCDEIHQCASRRLSGDSRKLASSMPAADVWEFLEEHFYQPTVLFGSVLIFASVWLLAMQHFPRAVVWGTLVADVVLLIVVFLWFYIETEAVNVACLVLAAGIAIFCCVCRKQIETSCVMLKTAMDGLFANRRIFFVTFGVQLVWAAFFAFWISAMITRMFVMEVNEEPDEDGRPCQLHGGWAGHWLLGFYMVIHYYWVTYFMRNVNVMVITANLSGWYFVEDDFKSNWTYALKWSLFHQAGGNAIAAAIMGFLEYILNRVSSTCNLVFAMLNPLEWIFLCLGLCLKTVAMTYTKFGVIAMAFTGKSFCASAPKAFQVLKQNLGDAVVTDYIGKRIMSWCTYVVAVGVGFAMWGWADAVQGISTLSALDNIALLTFIIILYAWAISYPFFGLVIIVLIEQFLSGSSLGETRLALNSIFGSLFVGCVAYFLLNFLSGIVVSAMDVSLFCFAVERSCGQKQAERFEKLYDSIKETFNGTVCGSTDVVVGGPVGGQADTEVPSNQQPATTVTVVGQPMPDA